MPSTLRRHMEPRILLAAIMVEIVFMLVTVTLWVLPKQHPTRIYLAGRLPAVKPAVKQSLMGRCKWTRVAAYVLIALLLFGIGAAIDYADPFTP